MYLTVVLMWEADHMMKCRHEDQPIEFLVSFNKYIFQELLKNRNAPSLTRTALFASISLQIFGERIPVKVCWLCLQW